jgi:hypothetical protein
MSRIHAECPDSDASDWLVAADVSCDKSQTAKEIPLLRVPRRKTPRPPDSSAHLSIKN